MIKNRSIVLVDDDLDDQLIFTAALKAVNENVSCECYDSAVDLLQTLQSKKENLGCIFLDLNLPFMHGFEFLESVKQSNILNNVPIIIYSTSSRDQDKIKARELGAYNFLSKPNSFSQLKVEIDHLLSDVLTKQ